MTAQINDRVFHRRIGYSLSGVKGAPLFDPAPSGVTPMAACTACWQGFHVTYKVRKERLLLTEAFFWLAKEDEALALNGKSPLFPGLSAKKGDLGEIGFRGIDLAIPFTGGLLITSKFISDLYVHMGFQSVWKFEEVHELIFESGRLVEQHDRSDQMAQLRDRLRDHPLQPDATADRYEVVRWIDECFSLNYE